MSVTIEFPSIKAEGTAEGGELRACRGCLATDLPLFDLSTKGLNQIFADFTGFPVVPTDTYPQHVCVMCKHLLSKFYAFRLRCHSAMYVIQNMVLDGVKISTESINAIDTSHLKLNLTETQIQIVSWDSCGESLIDGADTHLNIAPVDSLDLANEDSDDDKPLFVYNQFKDEKITITAVEIEEMLNESEELKLDSKIKVRKLATKRKGVKKENSPRKSSSNDNQLKEEKINITDIEIEETDDLNDVNFVLNESDESESDTKIEVRKLPMKRKRVKKENVPRKRIRKTGIVKKETVGSKTKSKVKIEAVDEEQEILKTIANIIRSAWMVSRGDSYTALWEKVHQESLNDTQELMDSKDLSKWTLTEKIAQFIALSKKLAAMYNAELKFSCVADQKKEIADRRLSTKYLNAPFQCELCSKHYSYEETYKRHMESHDPKSGDVLCEICLYRFKNRKRYMTHYHTYHTKKIVCKTCGVINREWNHAKQHFNWHGGAATVCEQCGKHFPDRKLLCMHIRSVHRAEMATTPCLLCGDTYNGATGVRMHMDKAHRQCARCPTCNTQFASEDALSTHVALSDRDAGCDGLSACPVCGHNFPSESSMREHYDQLHKKEFKCDQCGRVTDTLTQFTRHVRQCLARRRRGRPMRSEVRPRIPGMPREKGTAILSGDKKVYNLKLMCELCGKGNFKCFSTLRSHQRVHTGERPFQCDLCHKSFRELQFLKNHMMTHTDERRYKCPYCTKAFRQQGHRAAHILTHTKERPFACDTCSKRYTGQTALKEHINTAHRGLPPRQRGKNKERQEL